MPSVEMRRSTRVFVPKAKGDELVRVLRSGRRLWVESGDAKPRGPKNGDDWFPLIDNTTPTNKLKHQEQKRNGWDKADVPRKADDPMEIDVVESANDDELPRMGFEEREKMFRVAYSRKRRPPSARSARVSVCDLGEDGNVRRDRKFRLHFVRRKRRKVETCNLGSQVSESSGEDNHGFSIVVENSCAGCCVFSSLLSSIIRCMTWEDVGLAELFRFLFSGSISDAFALGGLRFLWGRACIKSRDRGICSIFGARHFAPLFTLDFSAAPSCFLHIHATLLIRSVRLFCLCTVDFHREYARENDSTGTHESLSYIEDQCDHPLRRLLAPAKEEPKGKKLTVPSGVCKLANRNLPSRLGVITRSASKRRRRSLRTRRARNPSHFIVQKASSLSGTDRLAAKKNASLLPTRPSQVLTRSARKNLSRMISAPKPSSLSVIVDVETQCCANLLVMETEKCYRIEGVNIMLDVSASNDWVLVIKEDGSTRHCLKVQTEMRPSTTNRFTHAVIWASDNGWKLEFHDRKEWAVFKELYKMCGERNAVPPSPIVKNIPVPGIREVSNSWNLSSAPFERPDSYIRMTSDELSRVLSRRIANYDLDSEDEEWLLKFNSELDASDFVSLETFELMIDAFEKASYCSPDDCSDEKASSSFCLDLASSHVAEGVFRHWMNKRRKAKKPLLRVFELNEPKRAQLIKKPALRKRRTLKRQATLSVQRGRGKDSSVLQAIAAEQSAAEVQTAVSRVDELKASAWKSAELAIAKRQRAQLLMENADLALYRATMALRIADAAQVADTVQGAAHFLDD